MFRVVFDKPNWFTKKFPMFLYCYKKELKVKAFMEYRYIAFKNK